MTSDGRRIKFYDTTNGLFAAEPAVSAAAASQSTEITKAAAAARKGVGPYGSGGTLSIDNFTNDTWAEEVEAAFRASAMGSYSKQIQLFMAGLDRYQKNPIPPNIEQVGLTFITRPRLNLQSTSLRQDRKFAPLDGDPATSVNSMQYMIRCLLDTKFCREVGTIHKSPLVDTLSPWFTPLCNALSSISGFPDPIIETYTTDAGFHSEDQTFVIGHDDLNKTYELSLTFKDIQHGPISAIFFYWLRYMYHVTKGTMLAYSDDIDNLRINYTVSIYRFVLDPTRQTITKFCKATGCFPKSLPVGAFFNFSEGDPFVSSSSKFTIPFVANKIEYMDYAIFADFNRLAERYWPTINTTGQYVETGDYVDLSALARPEGTLVAKSKQQWISQFALRGAQINQAADQSISPSGAATFATLVKQGVLWKCGADNFSGRPYVDTSKGQPRLSFRIGKNEVRI